MHCSHSRCWMAPAHAISEIHAAKTVRTIKSTLSSPPKSVEGNDEDEDDQETSNSQFERMPYTNTRTNHNTNAMTKETEPTLSIKDYYLGNTPKVASKDDSFSTVWKRRLGSIACMAISPDKLFVPKEQRELEYNLQHRLATGGPSVTIFEKTRERSEFPEIDNPIEIDFGGECLKDIYCVKLGAGLATFGLCRGGLGLSNRVLKPLFKNYTPINSFLWSAVAGSVGCYRVFNHPGCYMMYRCGLSELPRAEGRSSFIDMHCHFQLRNYQNLYKETEDDPKARSALANPSTIHLRDEMNFISNCLLRSRFQEQLRREKGVAHDSPLLPIRIPPPGVPKDGALVNDNP